VPPPSSGRQLRGRAADGERNRPLRASCPTAKGRAADRAAKATGKARRTLEKAEAVVDAAETDPERFGKLLADMDRTGRVDGIYRRMRDMKQAERLRAEAPAPGENRIKPVLYNCDLNDAPIKDNTIDWIFTDPPYPEESIGLYADMARSASKWLKPGGSVLAMAGQSFLPRVLAALAEGDLEYNWTLAYLTPGGQAAQMFPRKVNTFWKPVLWFTKGAYAGRWIGDVVKSDVNDNDKQFHHWGQSESGFADLLRRFVKRDDVVCDPFMGGGTTGVVAMSLGCNFVGVEKDASTFEIAKKKAGRQRGAGGI
jgi:16S rRNA G966 N2-methylase RsmD